MTHPKTVRRFIIRVGEAERRQWFIDTNKRLRGERIPHRCTCAQDHGWH